MPKENCVLIKLLKMCVPVLITTIDGLKGILLIYRRKKDHQQEICNAEANLI
jgi:hypothetical protein